jgi:glutamate:GABA antiporter
LANEKVYLVIAMLVIFWGLTVANFFGMRWSARLNDPGVVFGTLLPAAVLIVLGLYWLSAGRHDQIPLHASKLAPNLGSVNNLVFFVAVLLSYGGIENGRISRQGEAQPGEGLPEGDLHRDGADRRPLDPGHPGDRLRRSPGKAQPRRRTDAGL